MADMVDLGGEPQALGLAEQVAMGPESADRKAELRLVGDAETDRTQRPVGQLDVERQLAAGVKCTRGLDAHGIEHAERCEPAAQGFDLGRVIGLALLEWHAALQPDRVDLVCAREVHGPHAGQRSGLGHEGDGRFLRGVVDHDVALDASQRKALLAQFGDELVLRVQDGRGVGRIAGRQAQLGAIDRRQRRFAARWPDHNVGDAVARAGRDLEGEGDRIVVGPCVDGFEGRRLGDRPAVDRGAYLGIIVAARAQRAVDPRQGRLGALQKAQAVARQRLLLLEPRRAP